MGQLDNRLLRLSKHINMCMSTEHLNDLHSSKNNSSIVL